MAIPHTISQAIMQNLSHASGRVYCQRPLPIFLAPKSLNIYVPN